MISEAGGQSYRVFYQHHAAYLNQYGVGGVVDATPWKTGYFISKYGAFIPIHRSFGFEGSLINVWRGSQDLPGPAPRAAS